MNVTAPEDQFRPYITGASTSPSQDGNFLCMSTTATDADRQMQSSLSASDDMPLTHRIIYPFKATLSQTGSLALISSCIGIASGAIALYGAKTVTGFAGVGVSWFLGSVAAMVKGSSEYRH